MILIFSMFLCLCAGVAWATVHTWRKEENLEELVPQELTVHPEAWPQTP